MLEDPVEFFRILAQEVSESAHFCGKFGEKFFACDVSAVRVSFCKLRQKLSSFVLIAHYNILIAEKRIWHSRPVCGNVCCSGRSIISFFLNGSIQVLYHRGTHSPETGQ